MKILRKQEGNFTIKRLMENAGICRKDVSESTISRFLNKEGYYYLQARKKGLLTKADMKKRRLFARRMQKEYSHDVWILRFTSTERHLRIREIPWIKPLHPKPEHGAREAKD